MQHLGDVRRHDDQRSSGIDRSAGTLELELFVTKANLLEFDLPVPLSADGNVGDFALVRTVVGSAENAFSSIVVGRAEAEGEDGLVEKLLVDHVVEGGRNVVDATE